MKNILLVDDDPENRESVIRFLNNAAEQINILVATNGVQALNIAKKKLPDLIIMDWEMPEMDGIEATSKIKKISACNGIPIIMFTGVRTSSADLQLALQAGAIDFLRKPIENVELMARINSMLLLMDYFKDKIEAEELNGQLIQDKLDIELDFKHRELQAMTMTLVSKNELLSQIKHNITKLVERDSPTLDCILDLKKIISHIDSNLMDQNFWEDFKSRFMLLHNGFMEKLQSNFKDLTINEVKLCCFLKMNMSNKEIAQLLNSSIDSIDKSRYRLRKKLNIDSETNINYFLNSF
jgi:CheY-like chemotaxis protein